MLTLDHFGKDTPPPPPPTHAHTHTPTKSLKNPKLYFDRFVALSLVSLILVCPKRAFLFLLIGMPGNRPFHEYRRHVESRVKRNALWSPG